jgi:hypothetical protein
MVDMALILLDQVSCERRLLPKVAVQLECMRETVEILEIAAHCCLTSSIKTGTDGHRRLGRQLFGCLWW